MKKIIYKSWVARHLLFPGYSTITLAAWVCTKWSKEEMLQTTKNHECTHARQWCECMIASGVVIWILMLVFGISPWWLVLSFLMFYVLYGLEWAIKSLLNWKNAYKDISFEREANAGQNDETYLENSGYFEWVKYLKGGAE